MIEFSMRGAAVAAIAAATLLAGCERPPTKMVQHGYRGTGMDEVYNPRTLLKQASLNEVPAASPQAPADGPKASATFKNVQVLGDLSVAQFTRQMLAITQWVAPNEGCTYCHNPENLADDSKYTKVVARRMIQMTQHINADWKAHVAETGVTCYTCHRGNHIPSEVWFAPTPPKRAVGLLGDDAGQNSLRSPVGLTSLPYDPFSSYLLGSKPIRVNGTTALPTDNPQTIKNAEVTFSLMVHMSESLGVNCTYCHNTRSIAEWAGSPPQRVTAWHGIRMAREVNNTYMVPLTDTFPASRHGPTGDVAKVYCATCHQGAYKPLYGVSMLKDYPELATVHGASAASPTGTQAVAVPAAPAPGLIARVVFQIGSADLDAQAMAAIQAAAKSLAGDASVKVSLSGFTDQRGAPAKNMRLAKQRAVAVRDALQASGVGADRIAMRKPEFVIGGSEADARRVEITAAQ